MNGFKNGLIAAIAPAALFLAAHYTLDDPFPPLLDAYTLTLQWVLIGVIAHTSTLKISIFWSCVLWAVLLGLLGAAWGTYFGENVLVSLMIPQVIGGLIMGFISRFLVKGSEAVT